MHKGIILLVKSESKEDVTHEVDSFLESYQHSLWDWYVIGGRWTGVLDNYDPRKDPKNIEECYLCEGTGKRNDEIGKQARKENPEYTCNGCDGEGKRSKFTYEEHENNIMPLKDCLDVVKEWQQDSEEEFNKMKKEAEERFGKKSERGYNKGMYGYIIKNAGAMLSEDLTFDTNVYNTYEFDFSIPKDLENFYAVIVDIHN